MKRGAGNAGYTLIELTLAVTIISILAAVAIPKFSGMIGRSQEAGTQGNLASIRSALAIYYGATEGAYPLSLNILAPQFINQIPDVVIPAGPP